MRRFLAPFLALAFVACDSCRTDSGTLGVVPLAAAPLAAPACACAGGACEMPRAAALPVVGQYGVAFGQPGTREYLKAGLAIPPGVAACLVQGGTRIALDGIQTIQCVIDSLLPQPAPSQRLVSLTPALAAPVAPVGACGK